MSEVRLPLRELPERYCFLDPASGRRLEIKGVRARSAIVTVATDSLGRVFVLDAWAERCPTEQLIERVFQTAGRWSPSQFGVEANAMQSLFADTLVLQAKQRLAAVPFVAITQPTRVDKDWRIRTAIQPVLAEDRLFVSPDAVELRSELASFPMSSTKDLVDALASAIAMVPPRTPAAVAAEERTALADYLRRSGVAPAAIARRLAEWTN